ncbi:nucleotide exchange factor GrpE [Candidatus Poriferisocius sp.]|uniref:nucleotide exchange factor GrpE n=1 Tax=Candidatus Poriferisocius sp. TaxID=3101276 RepID=UPI003B01C8B0
MSEEAAAQRAEEEIADEQSPDEQSADEQSADEQSADEQLQDVDGLQEPAPSMEELVAQRDGYLNDLQRVTAEFANFRRKSVERQQETVAMAAAEIVEKVLPVLDACDAAVAQGAEDVIPIRDALFGALEKEGLAKLDDPGAPFDPTCHEAVVHEPGEGEAVIAEVLRAGYEWNSRVLRPAMVKVRG